MDSRMKASELSLLCVYATPSHEEATSSLFRPSGIRRHKSSELINIVVGVTWLRGSVWWGAHFDPWFERAQPVENVWPGTTTA